MAHSPAKRSQNSGTPADFQHLELQFVDHVQWSYELIRPLALIPLSEQELITVHRPPAPRRRSRRREPSWQLFLFELVAA